MLGKRIIFWTISVTLPIAVVILVLELLVFFFLPAKGLNESDVHLGWSPKTNFSHNSIQLDSAGNTYEVSISTNEKGFVAYGNPEADRPKVLFIGDSYTVGPYVSDSEAYFGQVGKTADVEVFAIGAEGYGSLQELMILQKFVGEIDPDIFVLQFCTNDFVNNSLELEGKSIVRNQNRLRPYFVGNEIVFRNTAIHWYRFLYGKSRIFRFLDTKLLHIQSGYYDGYLPPPYIYDHGDIKLQTDNGLNDLSEANKDADRVTGTLLSMMADTVSNDTHLLTFNCSTVSKPATERWERIAGEAGFVSLPEVSEAVEKAAESGVIVYASDGSHWSPSGHEIAAKVLVDRLNKIINKTGIK